MGKLSTYIIPVTPFQQNCTLLFDNEQKVGVLVDPGGDWFRIQEVIEKSGVIVEAIWITHGHFDHVGAAMQAKQALGVKIIGSHRDDKPVMDAARESAKNYGITDTRICIPDQWLEDDECVHFAGHVFKVFHTPGHSPGHVIYFSEKERFALLGDILFRGSIGRTDFPFCSHEKLMTSLREKVLPLGDDVCFLCGHGPGSRIGYERQNNPFLQEI
ncbi:MBL fold metallo-hydrolase [Bartonella vinsonii]|uniref:Metallo-beta-lactamase family protein n=1 Tax=Bartonella vinsonii subsp. berkhoffii str. Tweed TaxID=1094502 RepID=N6VMJ9_BARVB|nr:MBL fold metallo-hydrolase [Bartonella vinsonii]AGF76106.1 metallo-beta-lactamase family protein [Bartonella vinsonii subsp. berkhoffii str. Winnie]ENN94411.1 metallo-beta-lactamase family protein [Bartonella vinsonii subsp. berkhoffii str. Tweed]